MSKVAAMRKGRIEFYDDKTKKPRCPGCITATTYYQRPHQNGGERGGWGPITVWDDSRVKVSGPFETLAEADCVGRAQAQRLDCKYIAATPEEIAEAAVTEARWQRDAAAHRAHLRLHAVR